jgi:hypothetical protein
MHAKLQHAALLLATLAIYRAPTAATTTKGLPA